MQDCGDVQLAGEKGDTAKRTGSDNYLGVISAYCHSTL
jgi:hypothetical protein